MQDLNARKLCPEDALGFFVKKKVEALKAKNDKKMINSAVLPDISDDYPTNSRRLIINPELIVRLNMKRDSDSKAIRKKPTLQDDIVCQRSLVDRLVVENLAHNLCNLYPYSESESRQSWVPRTSRGRFSQTADRIRNALATQVLVENMSRDGHLFGANTADRLADAVTGPFAAAAAALTGEAVRIRAAAKPAPSAAAGRADAVATLALARIALSEFERVFDDRRPLPCAPHPPSARL